MADTDFFDDTHEKNPLKPRKIPEPLTRDYLLRIFSQVIRSLYKQVSIAKFKGQSDDAKLSYIRALISSIKSYDAILEKAEFAELEKRIEVLEK